MADTQTMEAAVRELLQLYAVDTPPIPLERILQHPHPDMWDDVDMNEFSGSFLNTSTPYSPRISLARFLARHIGKSQWGHKRGLGELDENEPLIHSFGRMIVMPADLINEIGAESRTPQLISLHFEVPEDEAQLRLQELAAYTG